MLLCPTLLKPNKKTKQKQNFKKKKRDMINKEFDNEQKLNGFIA